MACRINTVLPLVLTLVLLIPLFSACDKNSDYENAPYEIDSSYSISSKDEIAAIATDFLKNEGYNLSKYKEITISYMSDKTWLILFHNGGTVLDDGVSVSIDDATKQVLYYQVGYAPEIIVETDN